MQATGINVFSDRYAEELTVGIFDGNDLTCFNFRDKELVYNLIARLWNEAERLWGDRAIEST